VDGKFEISRHEMFDAWYESLKKRDPLSYDRIAARLRRIRETGRFGDCKPVGEGVLELRFHFSSGYRTYFISRSKTLILLLCAGDKSSQASDIEKAKQLAKEVRGG